MLHVFSNVATVTSNKHWDVLYNKKKPPPPKKIKIDDQILYFLIVGDTMSAEEDGHEDTQSSGLISRQVAELAKLEEEEEEEARKRTTGNPPSTQRKDQPLLSGETHRDDKDEDRPSLSSLPHPSGGGARPTNMDPPTSINPRPAIKSESPMGTADPQRGRPLSSTGPMPALTEQPAEGDINNKPNSTLPMRRSQSGLSYVIFQG